MKCSVFGCPNSSEQGYLLHKYPRDNARKLQWYTNIKGKANSTNQSQNNDDISVPCNVVESRVCEVHFTKDSYTKNGKLLKMEAVPTIHLGQNEEGNSSNNSDFILRIEDENLSDNLYLVTPKTEVMEESEILPGLDNYGAEPISSVFVIKNENSSNNINIKNEIFIKEENIDSEMETDVLSDSNLLSNPEVKVNEVSICLGMYSDSEGNDRKMSNTSYVPSSESNEDIPLQDSDLFAHIFKSLSEGNRSDSQEHGTSQSFADISLPGDEDMFIFKDSSIHISEDLNDEQMAFEVSYQQAKCKKNVIVSKTKKITAKSSQIYDTSESEYIPSSDDDEDQHTLENDTSILKDSQVDDEERCKITIGTSLNTKEKRVYDKSTRCYYCGKYLKDIRKHYLGSHSHEKIVSNIIANPVNSLARNNLLCKLRNLGNFKHNLDVIKNNKGELIVARRPSKTDSNIFQNFLDYVPCKYCYGFFKKHDLRRHGNTCPFNESASGKNLLSEGIILLHEATSENKLDNLKAVFESMRKDDVFYCLKNDEIILRLGSLWASKLKGKMEMTDINQKMRELARLLLELNKDKKNCLSLCQYLAPTYFDSIISGVENITYHSDLNKPKAFALKLGNSIKRCCSVKVGIAIRNNDTEMRKQAEDFLTLFNNKYTQRISSFALRSLYDAEQYADVKLPITKDIIKFSIYLENTVSLYKKNLEKNVNMKNWLELAQATLCRITIFNKRRGGEASMFLVSTYEEKPNWSIHQNDKIYTSLSLYEQKLCERLDLVRVKGKRGKHVLIILTSEVKESLDLLIKTRKLVGIPDENPYVFANASKKYFRAWETIRKYGTICKLENIKSMTSTNLRKYIATCSQILELSNNELEWLAKHLGHDITIHRNFYRLSDSALELAKVSKLLIASEQGSMHKIKDLYDNDPTGHNDINNTEICSSELSGSHYNTEDECSDFDKSIPNTHGISTPTVSAASEIENDINCEENMESPKKRRKIYFWSPTDKENIMKHFEQHIREKRAPGKKECSAFLERFQLEMDWLKVKNCVKNIYYTRK